MIVYDGPAAAFTDAQVAALYGTHGLADAAAQLEVAAAERGTPAAAAPTPIICR
jgi:hypothetical protein